MQLLQAQEPVLVGVQVLEARGPGSNPRSGAAFDAAVAIPVEHAEAQLHAGTEALSCPGGLAGALQGLAREVPE